MQSQKVKALFLTDHRHKIIAAHFDFAKLHVSEVVDAENHLKYNELLRNPNNALNCKAQPIQHAYFCTKLYHRRAVRIKYFVEYRMEYSST